MHAIKCLRILWFIRRFEKRSPARQRKYQEKKLRELLKHASEKVPLYKEKYKGIDLNSIGLDDLGKIPMLTKEDITTKLNSLVSKEYNIEDLHVSETSGSSGLQKKFFRDKEQYQFEMLQVQNRLLQQGWNPWKLLVNYIWTPMEKKTHLYQRLGFMRKLTVYLLDPLPEIVRKLSKKKIQCMYMLPSMLEAMFYEAQYQGVNLKADVIITGGETLHDETRKMLSKAYNAKVMDSYGAGECFNIAQECKKGKYHIRTENVIVEVLGKNNKPVEPGQPGDIVITNLMNKAMPIIRNKIGDLVVPGTTCDCGNKLPVLDRITGRSDDMIKLKGGRVLSPRILANSIQNLSIVRQYNLIQKDYDRFRMRVDTTADEDAVKNEIEKIFKKLFEYPCELEFEFGEIKRGGGGKIRKIWSEI
ncbi:phenylacetate--CoA ligase family protein [Nanoarchaeota archaeon]